MVQWQEGPTERQALLQQGKQIHQFLPVPEAVKFPVATTVAHKDVTANSMHRLCALQWQEDSKAAIAKAAQELQREGRYRHQFFQTPATVEVNILAKNLSPDSVSVRIQEQRLHVTTRGADGQQDYELDIPLYGQVGACTCTYTVQCGVEEYGAQAATGLMQRMASCARL